MVSKWTLTSWLLIAAAVSGAYGQTAGPAAPSGAASPGVTEAGAARVLAGARGYLRTLWVAQREYKKKNGQYATSLAALVGKASFTRRMAQPDRGEYKVRFHSDGMAYSAELLPKAFDPQHPAFYMDDSGVVRSEEGKPATGSSPEVAKSGR
jgi:hypothetical protein